MSKKLHSRQQTDTKKLLVKLLSARSHLLFSMKRYSEAIEDSIQMLQIQPESQVALLRYADSNAKLGNWRMALRTCYRALIHTIQDNVTDQQRNEVQSYIFGVLTKAVEDYGELIGCRIDVLTNDEDDLNVDYRIDFSQLSSKSRQLYFSILRQIRQKVQYSRYSPPLNDNIYRYSVVTNLLPFGTDKLFRLPRNFSSIIPFFLYGASTPRNSADIIAFSELKIGLLSHKKNRFNQHGSPLILALEMCFCQFKITSLLLSIKLIFFCGSSTRYGVRAPTTTRIEWAHWFIAEEAKVEQGQ
ncbi:hypothetical protein BKA69DRAFT_72922 [Paraphysoderma sedebokerense]|nr:hypothetical protein BKA69DRAFT_72922 [Paraphysoderma sedebokerense]